MVSPSEHNEEDNTKVMMRTEDNVELVRNSYVAGLMGDHDNVDAMLDATVASRLYPPSEMISWLMTWLLAPIKLLTHHCCVRVISEWC